MEIDGKKINLSELTTEQLSSFMAEIRAVRGPVSAKTVEAKKGQFLRAIDRALIVANDIHMSNISTARDKQYITDQLQRFSEENFFTEAKIAIKDSRERSRISKSKRMKMT